MKAFTSKKNLYLLALLVVTLLCGIIAPTYAKFVKEYTTTSDVAGVSLAFDIGITNIEEYEVITVPAGGADAFNVKVTNSSDSTLYYGIWYRMVEPIEKSSDVIIARVDGTTATTSGSLASNRSSTPSIVIINNSDTEITLNIGVASSNTSTSDIEYIGGKKLISGTYSVNYMNTTNGTNYFNSDTYRTYITNASFVDYIDTTNAALDENEISIIWDMSTDQDNGIIAWLEENETTDEEGNTYYDLYIGSNEKIYAKNLDTFFHSMSGLLSISFNNLNTSLTTGMIGMFYGCSSLTSLDLSNFNTRNVSAFSNSSNFNGMFEGCSSLISLDLSNFDTSNVIYLDAMFHGCRSLTSLDLSSFNTSQVTSMINMFNSCSSLTSLDLSSFDTSNVTKMTAMFRDCGGLIELDLSNFDTSNVTNMAAMFRDCVDLIELDLSNFDTSNVVDMGDVWYVGYSGMFYGCSSLINLDLSSFNTSNVTDFGSMFYGCNNLVELDLSNFDTSKAVSMATMFENCSNLINLSLGDFNISNVTSMNRIFYNCNKLAITLTINGTKITSYTDMFNGAATAEGASITLYYVGDNPDTADVNESTEELVEAMIATGTGNIINGGCTGDYCTIAEG